MGISNISHGSKLEELSGHTGAKKTMAKTKQQIDTAYPSKEYISENMVVASFENSENNCKQSSNVPLVAVIILSYNAKEELRESIRSVLSSSYKNLDVIIVDNNSTDGSVEMVSKEFPEVHIIKSQENLGFGGGNNIGMRSAVKLGADFMFFLNDDAVVDKDAIRYLVDYLNLNQKAAIAVPLILQKETNLILYAGGVYNKYLVYTRNIGWKSVYTGGSKDEPYLTQFCDFCAAMIRSSAMEKSGGFDTQYFLYANGLELSQRISTEFGGIYVIPSAIVRHKAQASANPSINFSLKLSPMSIYYYSRDFTLYIRRKNNKIKSILKVLLRSFFVMPYYIINYGEADNLRLSIIQFVKGTFRGFTGGK